VSMLFPAKVTMVDDEREDEAIDIVIGDKYKGMVPGKKALAAIQPIAEPQGCKAATPTPGPTES
jgi:hypothetical protein